MQKKRKRFFYFIPVFILAAIAVLSGVVMLLWNNVVTDVFNVKPIRFGQALGLFLLCKILFSSFRPGSPWAYRRSGPPWRSKLMDLSPEEREKFKQEWQRRTPDNPPQE